MSNKVISVEHLTKQYDLGVIGTGTLSRDLNRWWARVRHQPDPYTRIGQKDAFARIGESILALDDVSFTVNQGEALGIIGRNGAGKSTLLKILSRVTAPTSGVVKVRGRIGSLLEVGTGFHPELTGRENVYLNGAILGMKKAEVTRKFDEIVAFAGVEKFIDTPVKRYSSGMYVRLAFAVAAHLDPEILIVDEVLAVGDAEFQKKCLGKMGDVAGEGRTVLFVSHNMAAISNLCQNCLLLNSGNIEYLGDTSDAISVYLNDGFDQDFSNYQFETDEFRLQQIDVFQDRNYRHNYVTNLPLHVEFKYEVKCDVLYGLRVGFDVLSPEGVVIFRTFDDENERKDSRFQGSYNSTCTIPSSFFSSTDYYIFPRIGIHNVKWLSDNETRFKISFEHISGVNQSYADKRPGLIMPALEWNTNCE